MKHTVLLFSLMLVIASKSICASEDPTNPFINLPLPKHNLQKTKRMRIRSLRRLMRLLVECRDYIELKEAGIYLNPDIVDKLSRLKE